MLSEPPGADPHAGWCGRGQGKPGLYPIREEVRGNGASPPPRLWPTSTSSRGRVELATAGIINRREQLLVNGRDRTSQLDALEWEIARVVDALDRHDASDVGVFGALCFPFMRREWLHYSRARDGLITVDDPAHIAKLVKRAGPLTPTRSPGWPRFWPSRSRRLEADGQRLAGSRSTGTCDGNVGAWVRR